MRDTLSDYSRVALAGDHGQATAIPLARVTATSPASAIAGCCQPSSAEIIVEAPGDNGTISPLANFGTAVGREPYIKPFLASGHARRAQASADAPSGRPLK